MSARGRLLFVLASGHGISHWFQGAMSVCLPAITAELRITYTQIGLLRSLQRVAVMLSAIGGGLATDFLKGRKWILVFSVAWPSFFFFLQGYSTTLAIFITLIFIQNLCGGFLWHAPARATIGEKFPDRMGFSLGIHAMGGNIAQTMAPLAVGLLLGFATWRAAYKLTLIPGIIMASFLWAMLPQLKQARGRRKSRKTQSYLQIFRADILRNSGFLGISLVAALRSVGEGMFPVFLPLYLAKELGMSTSTIGVYLASLTLVGTVGAPAMGCFSDRWGRKPILFVCLLTGGTLMALIPVTASNLMFLPLTALAGLALFAVGPIIQASALEHTTPAIWGSAQTFMDIGRSVFSLVFPLFAGLIADHYGLRYAFYLVGTLNVLGAIIMLAVPAPRANVGGGLRTADNT